MGRELDIDDPGFDYYREERGQRLKAKIGAVAIAMAAMAAPYFFPETFATVAGPLMKQAEAAPQKVYYRDCSEAREANATPIYRLDDGYRRELDPDVNGIACEGNGL
jgi:hypothetical protein